MENTNPNPKKDKRLEDTAIFLDTRLLQINPEVYSFKTRISDPYEKPEVKAALSQGKTVILYRAHMPRYF
jgi:hypothetical protein